MLAADMVPAREWGERALALASRLGADAARAHALVNLGSVAIDLGDDSAEQLLDAHDAAEASGERHEAARALVNLAYSMLAWVRPHEARAYAERASVYAREHEVHPL